MGFVPRLGGMGSLDPMVAFNFQRSMDVGDNNCCAAHTPTHLV